MQVSHLFMLFTCAIRIRSSQLYMPVPFYDVLLLNMSNLNTSHVAGTRGAQSGERLTSAQVMISLFVSSSPTSGPVLSVQSPLQSLCLPLSLPLPC